MYGRKAVLPIENQFFPVDSSEEILPFELLSEEVFVNEKEFEEHLKLRTVRPTSGRSVIDANRYKSHQHILVPRKGNPLTHFLWVGRSHASQCGWQGC